MTPNPRGRMRFSDDEPDRGIRNLLYIIIGLLIVQLVITIGLWIDKPVADTGVKSEMTSEANYEKDDVVGELNISENIQIDSPTGDELNNSTPLVIPETIRVQILNGCGVPGLARRVQEWLVHNGYDVRDVGNADRHDYRESRIVDRAGNLAAAREVGELLGISTDNIIRLSDSPSLNVDITLIIGLDYKRLTFAR